MNIKLLLLSFLLTLQGKKIEAPPKAPSPVYMKGYITTIDSVNGVICYERQIKYTAKEESYQKGEMLPMISIALSISCVKVR